MQMQDANWGGNVGLVVCNGQDGYGYGFTLKVEWLNIHDKL
jgi:hypothetical protein